MEKQRIAITYKKGPFENAKAALSALDLSLVKGKSVLIKPNAGRCVHKESGINTHPDAIAAVIETLRDAGASRLAIGESPIVNVSTMEAFEKSGIKEVAEAYGVELIDLNSTSPVKKEIPGSRILDHTKICGGVYEFDLLLSLPVAKSHMHTVVTLGIKNLKGCLYKYEKVRYHQVEYPEGQEFPEKALDSAISDLATILLPDITVIDGYIGMEGLGPSGGEQIKSDFSVASLNAVGADMFGCMMMGFAPEEIPHLRLTAERRGVSLDPETYEVVLPFGGDYRDNVVSFKAPPDKVSIEYPNIVLYDNESCSACLSTVMLFLKRFHTDMTPYLFKDGKLYLAIGKGLENEEMEKGTILIGNCTRNVNSGGVTVSGCPPVPTRIYYAITGEEPLENEPEIK